MRGFSGHCKWRGDNIEIADFGLSAFAMFFMQEASFLAFQRRLETGQRRSNRQTLIGIRRIPSDNYIRDTLGRGLCRAFAALFRTPGNAAGRAALAAGLRSAGGRTLIAWDGAEYFCSQKLACPNGLTGKRSNGRTESFHILLSATVVAPGHTKVVRLMPEFVATNDDAQKQDCERHAVKRWFDTRHARLAPLRPIHLGDDLFACHPVAKTVTDAGGDFIFTAKQTSHKALCDLIDGAELSRHEQKMRRRATKQTFR